MLSRREFIKLAGAAGVAAAGGALVAGCGEARGASSGAAEPGSSGASADAVGASGSPAAAGSSADAGPSGSASPSSASGASGPSGASSASGAPSTSAAEAVPAASKPVVVYFSRAGENYNVGVVSEGNTAIVADMIAAKTGADTFEIVPASAYPEGYDECCDVALVEKNAGARPAYAGDLAGFGSYDTVYLGYPIWWGDLPMCVYTFIEGHDWAGKAVYPFSTHAGSGLAGTEAALKAACAGATVGKGFTVAGEKAQNARAETEKAVDAWLGA